MSMSLKVVGVEKTYGQKKDGSGPFGPFFRLFALTPIETQTGNFCREGVGSCIVELDVPSDFYPRLLSTFSKLSSDGSPSVVIDFQTTVNSRGRTVVCDFSPEFKSSYLEKHK